MVGGTGGRLQSALGQALVASFGSAKGPAGTLGAVWLLRRLRRPLIYCTLSGGGGGGASNRSGARHLSQFARPVDGNFCFSRRQSQLALCSRPECCSFIWHCRYGSNSAAAHFKPQLQAPYSRCARSCACWRAGFRLQKRTFDRLPSFARILAGEMYPAEAVDSTD